LLDLPPAALPGEPPTVNYLHSDRRGQRHTVAWRYADGTTWGVTFRNPPTSPDKRRAYDNPVEAARAIRARKHPPIRNGDVTAELLADRTTVCEPADDTGCIGLTAAGS